MSIIFCKNCRCLTLVSALPQYPSIDKCLKWTLFSTNVKHYPSKAECFKYTPVWYVSVFIVFRMQYIFIRAHTLNFSSYNICTKASFEHQELNA